MLRGGEGSAAIIVAVFFVYAKNNLLKMCQTLRIVVQVLSDRAGSSNCARHAQVSKLVAGTPTPSVTQCRFAINYVPTSIGAMT